MILPNQSGNLQCGSTLRRCRLIAIPTTSGTGSEVTSFAVVSDPAEQRKYPLVSRDLTPDEAILDAELVKSVPPAVTADTGMDVFTHALEACVSTDRNDFATALAEKAIEICGVFLLRAIWMEVIRMRVRRCILHPVWQVLHLIPLLWD